jgi:hypothetical protein
MGGDIRLPCSLHGSWSCVETAVLPEVRPGCILNFGSKNIVRRKEAGIS